MSLEFENQKIVPVDLEREMKKSYIDYAMSVIVGRALPDVRDGLKPVHRRILYAMYEDGLTPDKAYRKSATTVGNVLGRYHPHGDAAVYDALVRLAQDFSLRYPLIDGHGNFGSIDGHPAAAYRYTEARMDKLALEMLTDIEKETVDFAPNFDDKLKEPVVLPSRFPNLLVNGSSGIAVGMATNIPPHNLTEVINATCHIIDHPEATLDEIMAFIKGPDFPTGGTIMGKAGIRAAYATGRGKMRVRAKAEIEEMDGSSGRYRIAVTEIPYMVNKARLVTSIADLVRDKRVDGISDLRDESDRNGMRVVIELKRDANPQVVLNQLYKYTQMEETFSAIMLALSNNQPYVMSLREMLDSYIAFQKSVVERRTRYDLRKAEERAHILEGLHVACDNIDIIYNIIRNSKTIPEAKEALTSRTFKTDALENLNIGESAQVENGEYRLSDIQAQAIVDMRLGRLTGIERDKIAEEYRALLGKVMELRAILASEETVLNIVKTELCAIRDKFGDERRTEIVAVDDEIDIEDLIDEEECVYTLTRFGYIKRLPASAYRAQRRGGRGVSAMTTREEDFAETLITASTHDYILFFTNLGRVHKLKGYMVPESGRAAKGMNIVNLLQIEGEEKVTAMIPVREFDGDKYLVLTTRMGTVKRMRLDMLDTARRAGVRALNLNDDDDLIAVRMTSGDDNIVIATENGRAIRFNEKEIRPMGREAAGVRGIKLLKGDKVVGAEIETRDGYLLTVTENGFGKLTQPEEYTAHHRGGTGMTAHNLTAKTGKLSGIKIVEMSDDVLLITNEGIIIRTGAESIRVCGRASQGVILMRLSDGVKVISVGKTAKEEDNGEEPPENGADIENGSEE